MIQCYALLGIWGEVWNVSAVGKATKKEVVKLIGYLLLRSVGKPKKVTIIYHRLRTVRRLPVIVVARNEITQRKQRV